MSEHRWKPSVTVAAVIERHGCYLLVEEETVDGLRLNNPAGHLEQGETPLQAVRREALEETACAFEPTALLGLYMVESQSKNSAESVTYLRIAYCGTASEPLTRSRLDDGIVRTVWMTPDEVHAASARLRSPLVLRCIEDHRDGRRFPLSLVHVDPSVGTDP